jgi:CMP-N-acetylneuraminic acid synthetase
MEAVVLGIITARGGSKGVPGKNIKPLAGKPLLAWTIEAALQSRLLDRVIVSTDDEEIALVSRRWGAPVPFMRPSELAQDASPHILAILHALDWLEQEEGYLPTAVCLLQPSSPLRKSEDIDAVMELAQEKKAEAVVTVTEAVEHPVLSRRMDADGHLHQFVPCNVDYPRRQDLPPAYTINGAVYFNRAESLKTKQTFYPEDIYGYVMPAERSLQIDTLWEFHLADLILRDRLGMGAGQERNSP